MRIAIGGIRHETNTFSPVWTEYDDFRFTRGTAILEDGLGRPWQTEGIELLPTFVAYALPSGLVRRTAYERLKGELLRELRAILPVDGIYLDLHGAMEVEEVGDGEGDLVSGVRALVGRDVLISVSLDLHGNVSPTLVENSDILTAFRTAPHRDYEETRRRALALLVRALGEQLRPVPVLIKPPLLLAGESAVTDAEPAKSLYARLVEIDRAQGIVDASLLIGCAWTDSPYTSTSVIVVAERDRELALQQAAKFAREVWSRRHDFGFSVEVASLDESIRLAMNAPERPVFISDSGDNVTAGGAGDIPLFAERLLALGARDALVAGLADPESVRQCAFAGKGADVRLSIGGRLDRVNGRPFEVMGRVQHLSGAPEDSAGGPVAATIRVGGVSVVLTSDRRPFPDRASIFSLSGVDPMGQKIVVVKQGYLFPDLYDHVPRAIMALSPGATDLRLEKLTYRKLPKPIFPLDPDFDWEP
ncbi:MAG: M81 family metallopeptidase [bacterium]